MFNSNAAVHISKWQKQEKRHARMGVLAASVWNTENSADHRVFAGESRFCVGDLLEQSSVVSPQEAFPLKGSSRFAGCALAFGRAELFICES